MQTSTSNDERFFHIRNAKPRRHSSDNGTVFFRKEDDGRWYAAVARCSISDQFCRKSGRQHSRQRYFRDPENRCSVEHPGYDVALAIYLAS